MERGKERVKRKEGRYQYIGLVMGDASDVMGNDDR